MVSEISLTVLVFSAVGFAVLIAIPSVMIGLSPEERLIQTIKAQNLPPRSLLRFRSIVVYSLGNPAALWVFAILYLVSCILILVYCTFSGVVGESVAKIGIAFAFGTTIGVAGWAIIVPLAQYLYLRFAVKVLEKFS
jgi:hypothetical protein